MALETVLAARALLETATPLHADCGRVCGAACCEGSDSDGMLLFPGEEALYRGCAFGRARRLPYALGGRPARLFVCRGTCPREARPLSCRIFPARFLPGGDIAMDARARGLCPIYGSGLMGLAPEFREAARKAAALLARDAECRAFLQDLEAEFRL